MISHIHRVLNPRQPDLAAGRAMIWAAILADPRQAVATTFSFRKRWYRVTARPSGDLTFVFRSNNQPVSSKLESELIRFLKLESELIRFLATEL
jgi:hypothetical protein